MDVEGNITLPLASTLKVESVVNVSGSFNVASQSTLVLTSNGSQLFIAGTFKCSNVPLGVNQIDFICNIGDLVAGSQSQIQLTTGNESKIKLASCLDANGALLNVSVEESGSYQVSPTFTL